LAKIAVEFEQALAQRAATGNADGRPIPRVLGQGEGWRVVDVICTSGPQDRPFEERHEQVSIAIVLSGTFQYRSARLRNGNPGVLMTPGSLLLGNAGDFFECGHEHGTGDRCLSFQFAPDYFESIAADARMARAERVFRLLRLPPVRALSPIVSRARAQLANDQGKSKEFLPEISWLELGIQLAAHALRLANGGVTKLPDVLPSTVARITRAARMIEDRLPSELTLAELAREARLSDYHFLRTFEQVTGVTPHQYVRRARLREAAIRLSASRARVLDVALDCGFGDVSNFNRAFLTEFGASPTSFRRSALIRDSVVGHQTDTSA
jgi:AraC family transcriptional regulator